MKRNKIKPTLSLVIGGSNESAETPARSTYKRTKPTIDSIVEAAWLSMSVDWMLKVIDLQCSPFNRYMLLKQIVRGLYRQRKDDSARFQCIEYCEQFRYELPGLLPALIISLGDDQNPGGLVYKHYATVLTEDGHYQKAIDICHEATIWGMDDGTITGFEGRINRITKHAIKNTINPNN